MKTKEWFKKFFVKVNEVAKEDMSEYDPKAEYDTRVKLPEWQLKKIKNRKIRNKQISLLVGIEYNHMPKVKLHREFCADFHINMTMG